MLRHIALIAALALAACTQAPTHAPPHLEQRGEAIHLIVDDEPFLILGGELGNSTASDLNFLRPSWEDFQTLNMNTVLAPVSWELIEPREGEYDWSSVNGLIDDARAHDMRLVILWFGSWKNSMSSYAPAWVKRDQARFPRARDAEGRAQEILSPFHTASAEADARAFAALMAHIREIDSVLHTVIMVQVENEIGMLPSARDHSDAANAAYTSAVPQALMQRLSVSNTPLDPNVRARWDANGRPAQGTWAEVFGEGVETEELFMAYHFAAYTEIITAAGKEAYDLPMFVNAALFRPGRLPGEYPSAGPLPHVFDAWKAGAPSLDFLAPDIYFPNFVEWMDRYAALPANPLFIPEANRAGRAEAGADAFYAIGNLRSIGFSPFSIENTPNGDQLGNAYAVLDSLAPLIFEHQAAGTIRGMRPAVNFEGVVDETPQEITFGAYTLRTTFIDPWTPRPDQNIASHGALVMQLGPDEFLIAGHGATVTFATPDAIVGIESAWEGAYANGAWRPGRLMNGDQTHQGRHVRLPPGAWSVQRVRLYTYN